MKKRMECFAVVVACICVLIPGVKLYAATPEILGTDVTTPSANCSFVGTYGSYYTQAQEALNRINEIRKEACTDNNVPDPRNPSRMLSESDYVPMKWSTDLEVISRIRAAEGGLAFSFTSSGHNRLNGKDTFSLTSNGISSYSECLAYNFTTDMVYGINQWYAEKEDWVAQTSGAVTGHYTSLINPGYTYVGLGGFYTDDSTYPSTLAGEFCSSSQNPDETMQPACTNVLQTIEVLTDYISGYSIDSTGSTIYTDKTTSVTTKVNLVNGSKTLSLRPVSEITYTSLNPEVASVSTEGLVTGKKNGTTYIYAHSSDNTTLASLQLTVKCNHEKTLISTTNASYTNTGSNVYTCTICNETVTETIPKTPHNYVYGEPDSDGICTGICSNCLDEISIVPPTSYNVYWRAATSSSSYYYSYFPLSDTIPGVVYCWITNINGSSDYQDVVLTSTDETVIAVPDTFTTSSATNTLQILSPGITTLTIYPKYNASAKKQYVIRVGSDGSTDISGADINMSQTEFSYTGTDITPNIQISYHGTTLTEDRDYTIQYENNTTPGTANIRITGAGIFRGEIQKNFTILPPDGGLEENNPQPTPGNTENEGTDSNPNNTGKESSDSNLNNPHSPDKNGSFEVGDTLEYKGLWYKITANATTDKTYYVACTGTSSAKCKNIYIPKSFTVNDCTLQVIEISEKAFYKVNALKKVTIPPSIKKIGRLAFANCKNLKKVIIKSSSLSKKSIGNQCFKNIHKKAIIKVPAKKKSAYRKWFKKCGFNKKGQRVK